MCSQIIRRRKISTSSAGRKENSVGQNGQGRKIWLPNKGCAGCVDVNLCTWSRVIYYSIINLACKQSFVKTIQPHIFSPLWKVVRQKPTVCLSITLVSVLIAIRHHMWPVMPLSLSLRYLTEQQRWHQLRFNHQALSFSANPTQFIETSAERTGCFYSKTMSGDENYLSAVCFCPHLPSESHTGIDFEEFAFASDFPTE